jgi:alpha-L-fucosidase
MKYRSPASIINELIDTVSKNGNLLLNISPMGDGSIPEQQQKILLAIGHWLDTNGEAIYGTRSWVRFGEGPSHASQLAGATPHDTARKAPTAEDFRFTRKGDTLYAIALGRPNEQAVITSLAKGKAPAGKLKSVRLLGYSGTLKFTQDEEGLKIKLPAGKTGDYPFALKITGLKLK